MDKASPELEGYDEWIEGLFDRMPVEKKLLGIAPEQRLAGLDPAQRLAGLDPAHQVLALSDEVLRGFAPEYLATLPDEVQAKIRARIGSPGPR